MEPSSDDPGSSAALGAPDAARGLPQHPAEPYPFSAICGSPCLWLAPMVGQSEAAFRMLVRRYGVTLCTTPMIDPAGYARSEKYRSEFAFFAEDRPLVVQFGGSDAATLVAAAELVRGSLLLLYLERPRKASSAGVPFAPCHPPSYIQMVTRPA